MSTIKEKLSIVIITLNEERQLPSLLNCLASQTFQDFEVIIVDSDSEDDTEGVALRYKEKFGAFRFHRMDRRGASLGRNTGAALASHERILFLDADVEFPNDFLERMMKQARKKRVNVASCYLRHDRFQPLVSLGYFFTNLGFFVTQYLSPTAVGACILSTRSLHRQIGGFDEEIYLCEDCEYVKKAGKYDTFRMLPLGFYFNSRRLELEGVFSTTWKYLKANLHRLFKGELRNNDSIEYRFGHYGTGR